MQEKVFLRPREAAQMVGLNRQTFLRMLRAKKVPGVVRLSSRIVRIDKQAFVEWLRQQSGKEQKDEAGTEEEKNG